MGKLTDTKVKNARLREGGEYVLADGGGLSLRVRAGAEGKVIKSWILRYLRPADGRHAKLTLGNYPGMSLKDARKEAEKYRSPLGKGIDPKHAKAAERSKNAAELTMGELFKRWIAHFEQYGNSKDGRTPAPSTVSQHQWRWSKYLAKSLESLLVKDVTREHLAGVLDAMRGNTREQTRKAVATLRLMLGYAESRHLIEVSPARLIQPGDFGASKANDRERALSLLEMRQLWKALDTVVVSVAGGSKKEGKSGKAKTVCLSEAVADALRILLLTGARREEVTAMRWSELDLKASVWTLPKERTKNRREHTIYLSPLAVEILRRAENRHTGSGFVFESDRKPENPIHKDSVTTALERLQGRQKKQNPDAPLFGMEPFTVHDLRRSAATAWGEHCKTQPHVIERMLNHQPENKLVAIYQRQTYSEEQQAAWLAWGELVAHQVAKDPENVTPIFVARKAAS